MNPNNPPAFPGIRNLAYNQDWVEIDGMTLRDYFAAKALQGMIASSRGVKRSEMAKISYEIADDMLEARQ